MSSLGFLNAGNEDKLEILFSFDLVKHQFAHFGRPCKYKKKNFKLILVIVL